MTVSRWINGHKVPSKQTRRLWALRTGVPLEWLETGQALAEKPRPDIARSEGLEPPTFWLVVSRLVSRLRRRRALPAGVVDLAAHRATRQVVA